MEMPVVLLFLASLGVAATIWKGVDWSLVFSFLGAVTLVAYLVTSPWVHPRSKVTLKVVPHDASFDAFVQIRLPKGGEIITHAVLRYELRLFEFESDFPTELSTQLAQTDRGCLFMAVRLPCLEGLFTTDNVGAWFTLRPKPGTAGSATKVTVRVERQRPPTHVPGLAAMFPPVVRAVTKQVPILIQQPASDPGSTSPTLS